MVWIIICSSLLEGNSLRLIISSIENVLFWFKNFFGNREWVRSLVIWG